jgi:hypothetical protein
LLDVGPASEPTQQTPPEIIEREKQQQGSGSQP